MKNIGKEDYLARPNISGQGLDEEIFMRKEYEKKKQQPPVNLTFHTLIPVNQL